MPKVAVPNQRRAADLGKCKVWMTEIGQDTLGPKMERASKAIHPTETQASSSAQAAVKKGRYLAAGVFYGTVTLSERDCQWVGVSVTAVCRGDVDGVHHETDDEWMAH